MEDTQLPNLKPRTKIIATIGPATWDDAILSQMIDNGMTVARINASFADIAELDRVSKQIRKLSDKVAVMLDMKGHEVRINKFDKPFDIKTGEVLKIGIRNGVGDVWVNYEKFLDDIDVGQRVLIDDGNLELKVEEKLSTLAKCRIVVGGELRPAKTINLPDSALSFPPLTDKDKVDLEFAVENGFDLINATFVRNVNDVAAIKEYTVGTGVKIIAKIENREGLENLDSIINDVDGIMVARGDMGVELDAELVPIIQKEIVQKCRDAGKIVVVATQMLESMRENARPTRAEVSDVANAVFDGADAVMLSAETSTGKYPVAAVRSMAKACMAAEEACFPDIVDGRSPASDETDSLARAAVDLTEELPISSIVVGSKSGSSVITVARHRPRPRIIAFVNSEMLMRQLNLVYGVTPVCVRVEFPADRDWLVRALVENGVKEGLLKKEDMVALMTGSGIAGKSRNSILEIAKVFDICQMC